MRIDARKRFARDRILSSDRGFPKLGACVRMTTDLGARSVTIVVGAITLLN